MAPCKGLDSPSIELNSKKEAKIEGEKKIVTTALDYAHDELNVKKVAETQKLTKS